jgi:F0F1-type ATP synthase membrane subunit b/b'
MKFIAAILVAALIGFGGGYLILSKKHAQVAGQQAASESDLQNQLEYLKQALAEAKNRQADVRTITKNTSTTITNKLSAEEVLGRLLKLNPNTSEESRNRVFRQIVYHLQMLADLGGEALPVIHTFLKENKDVDYVGDVVNEAGERVSRGGFNSRLATRTDFLMPPSLRLGLIDVLDQVGTAEAEAVLAETLDTTGRGVEVAYIARLLEETNPNKYRENALKAAKELLSNPPEFDSPNRIDENARGYLDAVLSMYQDTSFAENANALLITREGRVDRQAMGYLTSTLKQNGVPALYNAYHDQRLTNQNERSHLLNAIMNFAGPSPEANKLFTEIISDEKVPAAIRSYAVIGLSGGAGKERPSDPALVQSRLELLRSLRGSYKDERLLKSLDDTKAALEGLLARLQQPSP